MSDGFSVLFQQARTYCPASRDIIEIKDDDRSGIEAKRSAKRLGKGYSFTAERGFDPFLKILRKHSLDSTTYRLEILTALCFGHSSRFLRRSSQLSIVAILAVPLLPDRSQEWILDVPQIETGGSSYMIDSLGRVHAGHFGNYARVSASRRVLSRGFSLQDPVL